MKKAIALLALTALILGCTNKTEEILTMDCERILDKDTRLECRYNQTIFKADAAGCKKIGDLNMSITCINKIAIMAENEYPCYEHTRTSEKQKCEDMVAKYLKAKRENKT